jgi:hypothetical protein
MCIPEQVERKMRKYISQVNTFLYREISYFFFNDSTPHIYMAYDCRCQYLIQEKFQGVGTLSDNCIFLCDDDNDIELAISCCFAFLPTISSDSMKTIAQSNSERIITVDDTKEFGNLGGTTQATDALLQNIIERFFTISSDRTGTMKPFPIL